MPDVAPEKALKRGEPESLPLSSDELAELADALMSVDPAAERHDLPGGGVEIDAEAMQLFLEPDQFSINVPYHFTDAQGEAVMNRAFEYAEVMTSVGGLTVWDPQVEEVVGTPVYDRSAAARTFSGTSQMLDEIVAEDASTDARAPRWKFWKRR